MTKCLENRYNPRHPDGKAFIDKLYDSMFKDDAK
jgi:hypothetical protein